MSAPAPPSIPPRPVKQQAAAQGVSQLPDIPPRPVSKRLERPVSPANFPGSPLNEPYVPDGDKGPDPLLRAPSVAYLPTPGEEGIEYANIQYQPQIPSSALGQDAFAQTRTIAEDLHLHAPKPSLSKAGAAAQVQGVTRTDIGRSSHDDLGMTRTRSRQSFSRPDSAASAGNRRRSIAYEDDHGPAEIGLRVPINPLLGDVQAPTPSGMSPQPTGESNRRHGRKKSGVDDFRPPDSYGLHGHGTIANSKFERDWYTKHPEQLEHEEGRAHGVYEGIGTGRGSFAMSSDELNKIVRDTASRGSGFGTNENIQSYPDEQIGYMASEVYRRSQQNTPLPEPLSRTHTRPSQSNTEYPFESTSGPGEDAQTPETREAGSYASQGPKGEEDEVYHVDQPTHRYNKVTGGQESLNETQEVRPFASHSEADGHEYTVPILAGDEILKHAPDFQHAAISPKFERRSSQQDDDRSGAITPTSRPASRPGSIYQMHSATHSLSRFISHQEEREHMHTPLEDVAEYEPLFEENEDKNVLTTAERFMRRPDVLQKRFPSQDIWEDTPNSAMYVAEVSTPDLPPQNNPMESAKSESAATAFETPEAEHARKGEVTESDKERLIPKEQRLAQSKFAPHLRDDMPTKSRPTLANRFPSQDVWEDTPDSSYLVTTVGSPQIEDEETSPTDTKPPVPTRPAKSRLGEGASPSQLEPSVAPNIPARPPKRVYSVPPADAKLTQPTSPIKDSESRRGPTLPDRPKPQVPPRPARRAGDEELTKVISTGSNDSTDTQIASKPKPQVPARPAGGNIASLKGNFMSDLNKKLGLGPRKEKEKELEPEDVKPLEDARKSRARGPQRRAPVKAAEPNRIPQFSIFAAQPLWQIDEADELVTIIDAKPQPSSAISTQDHATEDLTKAEVAERPDEAPTPLASAPTMNTAGEATDPILNGDEEGELTRKTTASTIDGEPIERGDSDPQAHVLPASRQTTANDNDAVNEQLERVATKEFEAKAEDEPIKFRNEQVNAAAPELGQSSAIDNSQIEMRQEQISKGEDKPQEPMGEKDIDYGRLEEMTAQADGKLTAEEDPEAQFISKKVVD